jgi:hypothetical protein
MIGVPDSGKFLSDFFADPVRAEAPHKRLIAFQRDRIEFMEAHCGAAGRASAERDRVLLGEWETLINLYEAARVKYQQAAEISQWALATIYTKVSNGELASEACTVKVADLPIRPGTGVIHMAAACERIKEIETAKVRDAKAVNVTATRPQLTPEQEKVEARGRAAAQRTRKTS